VTADFPCWSLPWGGLQQASGQRWTRWLWLGAARWTWHGPGRPSWHGRARWHGPGPMGWSARGPGGPPSWRPRRACASRMGSRPSCWGKLHAREGSWTKLLCAIAPWGVRMVDVVEFANSVDWVWRGRRSLLGVRVPSRSPRHICIGVSTVAAEPHINGLSASLCCILSTAHGPVDHVLVHLRCMYFLPVPSSLLVRMVGLAALQGFDPLRRPDLHPGIHAASGIWGSGAPFRPEGPPLGPGPFGPPAGGKQCRECGVQLSSGSKCVLEGMRVSCRGMSCIPYQVTLEPYRNGQTLRHFPQRVPFCTLGVVRVGVSAWDSVHRRLQGPGSVFWDSRTRVAPNQITAFLFPTASVTSVPRHFEQFPETQALGSLDWRRCRMRCWATRRHPRRSSPRWLRGEYSRPRSARRRCHNTVRSCRSSSSSYPCSPRSISHISRQLGGRRSRCKPLAA
jgi:hypothetical protein